MSGTLSSHSNYVDALFRNHYGWLCGRLRRHVHSRACAEDLAAETFAQLLASSSREPIREPRALLTTIAQRLMYQLWRKRDLERDYVDGLLCDAGADDPSPEKRAQVTEALQAIDSVLDRLPGKVKATFLLSHVGGLTYPQIASELGICPRSVSDYMNIAFTRCLTLSPVPQSASGTVGA